MIVLRPQHFLFSGWILWLLFYLLSPYQYLHLGDIYFSVLILLLYNVFFLLGIYSNQKKISFNSLNSFFEFNSKLFKSLFFTLFLGTLGSMIYLYTKFSLISNFSIVNLASNKNDLLDAGEGAAGLLGGFGVFLSTFSIVGYIFVLLFKEKIKTYRLYVVLFFSLLPVVISILLGSRIILFFYLCLYLIIYLLKYYTSIKFKFLEKVRSINTILFLKGFKFKSFIYIILLTLVMIKSFSLVQKNRLDSMVSAKFNIFSYWSENQQWNYDYEHPINYILSGDPADHLGILNFIHYQVHGVFEFSRNVSHVEYPFGIYYGSYQFHPILKIFNGLGLIDLKTQNELNSLILRTGVYTTFWGPFYIDFGVFGFIIIFFVGRFTSNLCYSFYTSQSLFSILYYPVVAVIIFLSPVINLLSGSLIYLHISIFLISIFHRIRIFKRGPLILNKQQDTST